MVKRIAAVMAVWAAMLMAGGSEGARAQSGADAQMVVQLQQIHDQAYARCMSDGRMGSPGTDLQANCSCAADVAMNLVSQDAKQAMADGTFASFKGPLLQGDEMSRDVTLLKTCPKVGAYLQQQYCGKDASNPHCQVLEKAQQQAQ